MNASAARSARWLKRFGVAAALCAAGSLSFAAGAQASDFGDEAALAEQLESLEAELLHSKPAESSADSAQQSPLAAAVAPGFIQSTIGNWVGNWSSVRIDCDPNNSSGETCGTVFTMPDVGQTGPISYVAPNGTTVCLSTFNDTSSTANVTVLWTEVGGRHDCRPVTTERDEVTGMVGFRVTGGPWDGRYLGDESGGKIVDFAQKTMYPVDVPGITPTPVTHPELTLVKTATPASVSTVGETVTYSFEITNSGDVALADVAVEEQQFTGSSENLSTIECPTDVLEIGESTTCTASYSIQESDVESGGLSNTAVATATFGAKAEIVSSATSTAIVVIEAQNVTPAKPTLSPEKAASVDTLGKAADSIANTGGPSAAKPIAIAALLATVGIVATVLGRRSRQES